MEKSEEGRERAREAKGGREGEEESFISVRRVGVFRGILGGGGSTAMLCNLVRGSFFFFCGSHTGLVIRRMSLAPTRERELKRERDREIEIEKERKRARKKEEGCAI